MATMETWKTLITVGVLVIVIWVGLALVRRKSRRVKAERLQSSIDHAIDQLTDGNSASFEALDAVEYGYRPVSGETLLQVHNGLRRMEMKSTGRYSHSGTSVSVPITKGVRIRVGGGSVARGKSYQEIDTGRLLVTDKALVFEGRTRNDRWTWGQIADVDICRDGYAIHRRRGKPVELLWSQAEPMVCAVIDILL